MPSLQRTPLGFYCQDLAEYRGRLQTAVGEGDSRKNFLREQILKDLEDKQLCKILDFNFEEIIL